MKWIPVPLGRYQRIIQGIKKGGQSQLLSHECYQVWKLLHTLGQVRATTCSKNQPVVGGRGGCRFMSEFTSSMMGQSPHPTPLLHTLHLLTSSYNLTCTTLP